MFLLKSFKKGIVLPTEDNLEDFLSILSLVPLSHIDNPHALLQTFKCSKNKDLEDFLHHKALDFGKRGTSKTHLLLKDEQIIGYFTLSMKPILTEGISKEVIKKIDGFSKNRKCIYFYLIGEFLLFNAISLIEDSHLIVGGRYILVDAFDCLPVPHFYEQNGFTKLVTQEESDLSVKMMYRI